MLKIYYKYAMNMASMKEKTHIFCGSTKQDMAIAIQRDFRKEYGNDPPRPTCLC